MKLWDKIVKAHGSSGTRTHNQIRLSLTLIGLVFIVIGILGLLRIGEILSNDIISDSHNSSISYAIFLAIGIIAHILRLTLFKEKRSFDHKFNC